MESKDRPKLEVITQLGQGGFGSAYKVINKSNEKIYILKKILIKDNISDEEISKITDEACILAEMKGSENIVTIFDSFFDKKDENLYFNIVLEYCEGLDLRKFINDYKSHNHPIPNYIVNYILKQICNGLKEIHRKNLIHRDLKPENIFITNEFHIKIGDFGITKQLDFINKYANTQIGTLQYMAPEIIKGEKYNQKVDIWSLGCIIYELCSMNFCFKGKSILDLASNITNSPHGTIDQNTYGENLQKIIDKSLIKDYKDRADIDDILNLLNDEEEKFVYNFSYNKKKYYNEVNFQIDDYEQFYDIDGKEKGIIVMDLGSCYCRAGFRGQSDPATCFPTCVARKGKQIICGREDSELQQYIKYPFKDYDAHHCDFWDDIESLYRYIFYDQLRCDPEDQIIVTTKLRNGDYDDMHNMEVILFENLGVSGLYMIDQSLLSLISVGIYTGIVVDIGYKSTNIVPIFDGSILSHAITTLSFGGNDILKEGSSKWHLPDLNEFSFDENFAVDALFKPTLIDKKEKGIGEALISSIQKCDKDLEMNFYENIYFHTTIWSFQMEKTIREKIIDSLDYTEKNKYKDIIHPRLSRSPFNGGDLLSSNSFFGRNMYVSKDEFQEYGDYACCRKFVDTI